MDKNTKTPAKAWSQSDFFVTPEPGKARFHDFSLNNDLMHAIADLGFQYCSPIQQKSLPYSLAGHDVLGKAQTGTGKTAAFLVGVIEDLLSNPIEGERYAGEARALILAPTRELVLQIYEDAKALIQYTNLHAHALVGGMDYHKQLDAIQRHMADIIVATPGRLIDFVERGDVHLDLVEMLVIDEADRMLDMGFIPQIRRIVRLTPRKTHRQTLFFSATFSEDVLRLSEQWTHEPVTIEIESESVATDSVEQHIYLVSGDEKFVLLYNLLQGDDFESSIVFANRRDECRDLHHHLKSFGFKVGLLSGEIDQKKRVRTLDAFRSGEIQVLVATDVAGRGIHIDGVSHVVNFTLPEEPEDYVHRIGRTGRAGTLGVSISFACEDDAFRLPAIEDLLGGKLKCEQPPLALLDPLPKAMTKPPVQKRTPSSGNKDRGGGRGPSRPRRR